MLSIGDLVQDKSSTIVGSTSYFNIDNFRNKIPRVLWKTSMLSNIELDEFETQLHGEISGKLYGNELATILEISDQEYFFSVKIMTSTGDIGWINQEYLVKVNN